MPKSYAATLDELTGIVNALHGWKHVDGYGPEYFPTVDVSEAIFALVTRGQAVPERVRLELANGRARVFNFFALVGMAPFAPKQAVDFLPAVDQLLSQLQEQSAIAVESLKALCMGPREQLIYWSFWSKISPILFYMGFNDAIPHSSQVSRLQASICKGELQGSVAEILICLLVGLLHDPKLDPDLSKQNLATHPIVAMAIAYCVSKQQEFRSMVLAYFGGNKRLTKKFRIAVIDVLGLNNDSRFVTMMVTLPAFITKVSKVYGQHIADQYRQILEERLASGSKGVMPPDLPDHLRGALSQMRLDTGLWGISGPGLSKAIEEAGIHTAYVADPGLLFNALLDGNTMGVPAEQLLRLQEALRNSSGQRILKAEVRAISLLQHHQLIKGWGKLPAKALVFSDSVLLSSYKVKNYNTIASFIASFDDNIRLLPQGLMEIGMRWQRVVYLSVIYALCVLDRSTIVPVREFEIQHASTTLEQDLNDSRAFILQLCNLRVLADIADEGATKEDLARVIAALQKTYTLCTNKFREAIYAGATADQLAKFSLNLDSL